MDEEQIITLFFARSEQAIEALDAKYGKLFHSLSYHIVNDRQDADECVNDAYLGAWNAIPPAKPDSLLPYMARIVRNISLKCYWKKGAAKRNSPYTLALQEVEECLPDRKSAEEEVEARELARDIAGLVGLSEKNISVRLARIRRKLKQYLAEREAFL